VTLRRAVIGIVFAFAFVAASAAVNAQRQGAVDVAAEVASLMTQQRLDVFAVQDPDVSNGFLAVLLVPKAQLLVVSAEYPTPAELTAQLAQKNYRKVYTALHQPATAATRFFLLDVGCDGLRNKSDAVDVLYEKGVTRTLLNGDWKSQDLSEVAYRSRAEQAERRYGQILSRLVEALRASPVG
jgi:hypothetical protein